MFFQKLKILLFVAWLPVLVSSCDSGTTGQQLIAYPLVGQPLEAGAFTDARGWEITLTRAKITFGPLVFCSHQPTFFKRDSLTDCGQVMGEMTQAAVWDLLAQAPVEIGQVSGIEGQVHSLQYDFGWHWPPGAGEPSFLGDAGEASLELEGEAVQGGDRVAFSFRVDVRPQNSGLFTVAGLAAEGAPDAATLRARVRISPERVLRYVDFSLYAQNGGVLTAPPGSALENQLRMGLVSGSPLQFEWE